MVEQEPRCSKMLAYFRGQKEICLLDGSLALFPKCMHPFKSKCEREPGNVISILSNGDDTKCFQRHFCEAKEILSLFLRGLFRHQAGPRRRLFASLLAQNVAVIQEQVNSLAIFGRHHIEGAGQQSCDIRAAPYRTRTIDLIGTRHPAALGVGSRHSTRAETCYRLRCGILR